MEGIAILSIVTWIACMAWVALDLRERVINLVFWPFPTLAAR